MSQPIVFVRTSQLLIDTNVMIDALRNRFGRGTLLEDLAKDGHLFVTSAINVAELYAGLRPGEEVRTLQFLGGIRCIPVTAEIAVEAGNLRAQLRRVGRTHTLDDMVVAATALAVGCPLLTDNRKDFQIDRLVLFPQP